MSRTSEGARPYRQTRGDLIKFKKPKRKYIIISLLLIAALLFAALNNRLTVTTYTIESEKITAPIRAVLLTDLHSSEFGEKQAELIAAIDAQQPDFILRAGDIADDVTPNDDTIYLADGIA
ncbi:MAG: metallophosphoesterase, partial [Clostridiales bacterium]|nr:metallophosphoesterase [Clostridiales bacterium]